MAIAQLFYNISYLSQKVVKFMQKECRHHRHRLFSSIVNKSLSQQQLGSIVRIIFFVSLIPLILIAFYNYPADDDFGFSLPAATAWVTTHSLLSVLQAVVDKTVLTYTTWQGNFASTFLFCVSPMIFNIHLYFISNWCLLALLCLSVGYLLKGISKVYLSLSRSAFWIFYFSVMVLMLQFMPHISDSVFWYNGGQYTAAVCTLIFIFGLLLRCMKKQNTSRSIFRGLALAFLGLMMGGSFYGPALGALVSLTLIMVFSFIHKSENRWYSAITLLFFCIAFIISIVAPGVSLRQEHTGETVGVVRSIIKSVLDSFDLTGKWLSPELFAMLMLIIPVLWKPLKESTHRFNHPLWVLVTLYGMFASSLTPGIYTGFGYDTPRYINAIYLYFIMMVIGTVVYIEGSIIRFLQKRADHEETANHILLSCKRAGERFSCIYLVLCITMLVLGGFRFTIMNTSSIGAAKSLVTGEAACFSQEMQERQEYIRVTDSDLVKVNALSQQPYVFKYDRLPFQGIYGRVRYMKWYFELFYQAQHGNT